MPKKETYTVKKHQICIDGKPFAVLKPLAGTRQADVDTMTQIIVALLNHDLKR